MKCNYCQGELEVTLKEETDDKPFRSHCRNCDVTYRYLFAGGINSITWKLMYRNKEYRIQVCPNRTDVHGKPYDNFTVSSIEVPLEPEPGIKRERKIVFRFDFVPDWTPQNTLQKLSTYLAFL